MSMGKTIVEKILGRAAGGRDLSPGDIAVVDIDLTVLIDTDFFPSNWRNVHRVANPAKVVVVFDHRMPAPDRETAEAHVRGREFVRRFGIERFHDVGRNQGISHVVVADNAYALPGTIMVCEDSHTCSAGAFNCAGRGIGGPDMIYAVTTGKTWFCVGETIRYELRGRLGAAVSTKDVFLHMAGHFGDHTNQNLEFGGDALPHLSMDARRTLTTMGAELSCEFAIFDADDVLLDHVRQRNPAAFEPVLPDADATYRERRVIDLDRIEPLLALPDAMVNNTVPVLAGAGERIDQGFIGSCANGTLEDIAVAAKVVAGRRLAPGVRLIITPGSERIYREAVRAGYVLTLMEAGAIITNATCGACAGGHLGVLGPGETCITSSTRNYKGRMGADSARIFLASTATVAASAVAGVITHPGEFLSEAVE
jgi:3-isopropylmalate/(R)-2-methylmalate dehydratase large subunit